MKKFIIAAIAATAYYAAAKACINWVGGYDDIIKYTRSRYKEKHSEEIFDSIILNPKTKRLYKSVVTIISPVIVAGTFAKLTINEIKDMV